MGEIVDKVIYYSAELVSGAKVSADREVLIRENLRTMSMQLRSRAEMVSAYTFWAHLRFVPSQKDLSEAAGCLMGLSNSFEPVVSGTYEGITPKSEWVYRANHAMNQRLMVELQHLLHLKTEIFPDIAKVNQKRNNP